ncbi:methyltransferase [Sphingomonas pituitosa]|uniref:methyltransferase n=1 Tax=Sphingomonas pituitosa TaxID=99597 RepID=UPI00082CE22C|nr:class I SAM-dependent methyltransferase [Sphingomonas pituitosa]
MENFTLVRKLFRGSNFLDPSKSDSLPKNWRKLVDREDFAPILYYLDDRSRADLLFTLFFLGMVCRADVAREVFGAETVSALKETGFVEESGTDLLPVVMVQAYGDLLVASDPRGRRNESDYVMGLSGPTRALADLTIRKPASLAVDIGCGSGLHALLASRHSARVLACDVNPRALDFTRLNAQLNGITNIDMVEADLFDFALDGAAEMVVCNPPYVISPDHSHPYRDSGREEDGVCAHLAGLLPRLLRPDGTAQYLANWAVHEKDAWPQRLEQWFAGSGCHVSVLHEVTEAPADYTIKWLRQSDPEALAADKPAFARWMDYFDRRGICGIAYGLVTIQRTEGAASFAIDAAPDTYVMPCGDALAAFLARKRQLRALDGDLLDLRLRRASNLRLAQSGHFHNGPWIGGEVRASLADGLCWSEYLDPASARLFERVDGQKTLGAVIGDMLEEADPPLIPALFRTVVTAIEKGFLTMDGLRDGEDGIA